MSRLEKGGTKLIWNGASLCCFVAVRAAAFNRRKGVRDEDAVSRGCHAYEVNFGLGGSLQLLMKAELGR
jgi:hypothetical protein